MQDRSGELDNRVGDLLRYAVVDSVDLGAGKVMARVRDKLLGPLDWFMPRAGETVVWSPPSVGEQGLLLCPEADSTFAVFLPGVRSSKHAVTTGDARALVVTFKDGAVVAYDPDAHLLSAALPEGGSVEVTASGGLHVDGPITSTHDIMAQGDVTAGTVSLRHHTHGNVQNGGGFTAPPVVG